MEQEIITNKVLTCGKRKNAVARVQLLLGKGDITVNGMAYDKYFVRETERIIIKQPLLATKMATKFDIVSKVSGGGNSGQAGALKHGISKALVIFDPTLRPTLRKMGFLTRDPRAKERKKYGLKGARKRFQWTKR